VRPLQRESATGSPRAARLDISGSKAECDGRVSVVKLTDEGKARVQRIEAYLDKRFSRLVADWPTYKQDAIGDA
jgi:hypothetical protein